MLPAASICNNEANSAPSFPVITDLALEVVSDGGGRGVEPEMASVKGESGTGRPWYVTQIEETPLFLPVNVTARSICALFIKINEAAKRTILKKSFLIRVQ